MSVVVDTTEKIDLNIEPTTVEEEVIQNLWVLYSSLEYDCPLDRGLGMKADYIDRPIETAKALAMSDIYEKTEEYEPRADIVDISFSADYENGILKPIVEVEVSGEYENEEYTE
nr:hypothetical protein [uncultured Catonella sp.]